MVEYFNQQQSSKPSSGEKAVNVSQNPESSNKSSSVASKNNIINRSFLKSSSDASQNASVSADSSLKSAVSNKSIAAVSAAIHFQSAQIEPKMVQQKDHGSPESSGSLKLSQLNLENIVNYSPNNHRR